MADASEVGQSYARRFRADVPAFVAQASNTAGAPGSATDVNPNLYATGMFTPDQTNTGDLVPTSAAAMDWAPVLLFLAVVGAIFWAWREGYAGRVFREVKTQFGGFGYGG